MENSPSFSGSLFEVAQTCAANRLLKHCKAKYGSNTCTNCKWYIGRYVDAPPNQTDLFMMRAESTVRDMQNENRGGFFLLWVGIIFCLIMGFRSYYGPYETDRRARAANVTPKSFSSTQSKTTGVVQSQYPVIDEVLDKVAKDYRAKVDVDRDGLTDCHDAATLFYRYYPWKDKVCVEMNDNPTTGMCHLFNCVLVDGVWRAVEPQAYVYGKKSYWMQDFWGKKYDRSYNVDVTQQVFELGWLP